MAETMKASRRSGIWRIGRFLRIYLAGELRDWADRLDPDAMVDRMIRSGTLPTRPDGALSPPRERLMSHVAKVIEIDPDNMRGYPPDVHYQTGCSTCGTGYGPITLHEAKAWVRGHDSAISSTAYLRDGRYCSLHGIDLVPWDRTQSTRRYCPQCPEGSPLGRPSVEGVS